MSSWDYLFYEWVIITKGITLENYVKLTVVQLSKLKKEFALYYHSLQ